MPPAGECSMRLPAAGRAEAAVAEPDEPVDVWPGPAAFQRGPLPDDADGATLTAGVSRTSPTWWWRSTGRAIQRQSNLPPDAGV
ncbi:hypothetical protein [Streptantibioticus silvisoli]|uniref:Uncharacterized protein n=1 Tax=Streptantibioticus silvisoli TaxID=2705255 RepID=A0ABT6VXP7_9ACTN|nr:hypothetical protein [Streptantibioticus silvisoli]MDI5963267.1 hypothetical protein [Streptantibioticus silvisoli]